MAKAKNIEQKLLSGRQVAEHLNINESALRRAWRESKFTESDGYDPISKKFKWPMFAESAYAQSVEPIKAKRGVSRLEAIEKIDAAEKTSKKGAKAANKQDTGTSGIDVSSIDVESATAEQILSNIKITEKTDMKEAMRLREVFGALLDKNKLQEQERILVKRADVEKVLFDYGMEIKKALITIPERVTADMRAAPTDVDALNILKHEIINVLSVFSKTETILNQG